MTCTPLDEIPPLPDMHHLSPNFSYLSKIVVHVAQTMRGEISERKTRLMHAGWMKRSARGSRSNTAIRRT